MILKELLITVLVVTTLFTGLSAFFGIPWHQLLLVAGVSAGITFFFLAGRFDIKIKK